ncbi:MAG: ester cyclase [Oligoflexia bacterium]|nr:ester cyclase [Oligoflexia bacterium]
MAEQTSQARPVEELYAALNRQDLGAFDKIVAEEVEYTDFAIDGTIRGRDAFKKHFKNWWTAFPKGSGEIRNLIVLDDQVVVEVLGRGNHTGPFETGQGWIEPTNRMFELHFCQIFRVKNGLIVGGHSYSDAFKLLEGLSEKRKVA